MECDSTSKFLIRNAISGLIFLVGKDTVKYVVDILSFRIPIYAPILSLRVIYQWQMLILRTMLSRLTG